MSDETRRQTTGARTLLALADKMRARGVRRFSLATGEVEFWAPPLEAVPERAAKKPVATEDDEPEDAVDLMVRARGAGYR